MKKKFTKRLLSWVMAAAMVISMLPISAMATGTTTGPVAQIDDTTYTSLDTAVEEALEGSTITLLQDCELTKGFNKTLTFTGNGKITINKQLTSNGEGWMCFGLYDPSRVLTFDGPGIEVEWNSEVGTAPWLMLSLSGTMNVTNGAKVTFTVDSGSTGSRNAIYMNDGSSINVTNGSSFTINGYGTAGKEGQGIQLDKTGKSTINVTNKSSFTIDGTNRGYVNSPAIYVEDSTFTVQNCTANGSNGGNFTAINSKITYQNNAGHGLSAGNVIIKNSDFVADNNGYYGIYASAGFSVDGTSKVTVTHNSYDGDFAGLKLTGGVTDGKVEKGAVVTITDNYCSGLSNNGKCVFEEGVDLTIMNNDNSQGGAMGSHGGGIYNSGASADLTLPSDAVIYNNHALTDGDDIFNNTTSTIKFGKVDPTWVLDDCDHLIDGWYDDSEGTRWEAHADTEAGEENHIEAFTDFAEDTGLAAVAGLKALKAAHGEDAKGKGSLPALDKQIRDDNDEDNWEEDDEVKVGAGDTVYFQLNSNVPSTLFNYINPEDVNPPIVNGEEVGIDQNIDMPGRGSYELIFHDVMDPALIMKDDIQVTIGGEVLDSQYYTVTKDNLGDECTFEITMDLVELYEADVIDNDDITGSAPIVVTYSATLNEEAEAGSYLNTAWVSYPEDTSSPSIVTVNTYGLNIFKYDQATIDNEDGPTGLEGAVFQLYQKNGAEIIMIEERLVSDANGNITVKGLDAGTYYLKEITPPEGYVCSTEELQIIIPDQVNGDNNIASIRFANSLIPHTGGMGTTMFSIVGGALIATAGVIFVISRKKRARNAA